MDLATTISIVVGLTTTYLGSMYFITSQIGDRIRSLELRMDRLEERITHLEEVVMSIRGDLAVLKATH